jgi:hypothetical protein
MMLSPYDYEDRVHQRYQDLLWLARIAFFPPAAVVYLVVHLARRLRRWYIAARAKNWTKTDACVSGSYEIDESQSLLSLQGWRSNEDEDEDYAPRSDEDEEYTSRLAVAIQYSYHADGELQTGTYFLPDIYKEGDLASEAEKAWAGRKIVIRYNPARPTQSFFLVQDGAPGKPHIPRLLSYRPYVTDLSLK